MPKALAPECSAVPSY